MAPLRQLVAITDDVEFGVAEDVVPVLFEEARHVECSFRCIQLQRVCAVSLFRKAVPDFEIGDPKLLIYI